MMKDLTRCIRAVEEVDALRTSLLIGDVGGELGIFFTVTAINSCGFWLSTAGAAGSDVVI